ncbi:MAG: deoxyribodipyrimidine photo-lyase, partial [Chitinophagaceae bacterium]|nr:deoxyribodipyrimidine photo-lyase [Chitinophagaceae bacterium]
MPDQKITLFWFRRDLRLADNAGLYHALRANRNVLPVFIFDPEILGRLDNKTDARVCFIYKTLENLKQRLNALGSDLLIFYGQPKSVFTELCATFDVQAVYTNRDYEPYAIARDREVKEWLGKREIPFHAFKDQVIFDEGEVVKDDGSPYTVFTPYSKRWKAKLNTFYTRSYPTAQYKGNYFAVKPVKMLPLEAIGFHQQDAAIRAPALQLPALQVYGETRDFPGIENGTTQLGIHFRFGTVSIREMVRLALTYSETWL